MKLYPHEAWLKKNSIDPSECPADIAQKIASFEAKFGDIDPDDKHEAMPKILGISREILAECEEHFTNPDLEEDMSPDEKDEYILGQVCQGSAKGSTTLSFLNAKGFSKKLAPKSPVLCGKYTATRDSAASTTVTIRQN